MGNGEYQDLDDPLCKPGEKRKFEDYSYLSIEWEPMDVGEEKLETEEKEPEMMECECEARPSEFDGFVGFEVDHLAHSIRLYIRMLNGIVHVVSYADVACRNIGVNEATMDEVADAVEGYCEDYILPQLPAPLFLNPPAAGADL